MRLYMSSLLIALLLIASGVNAAKIKKISPTEEDKLTTKLVSSRVKEILENGHYKVQKLNNEVSKQAFAEFLQRLDYGKQFFLKSDIKKLKSFELNLDDEIISGKPFSLEATTKILRERVVQVEKYSQEIFKKKFTFKAKEKIEVDSDKRDYLTSSKDLKDHWRKVFKHSVLSRYVILLDDQDKEQNPKKDKKKNKKKKKKTKIAKEDSLIGLTKAQLRVKAHKYVEKNYKNFFKRMKENEYSDYFEMYINSINTIYDPHTTFFPPKKKKDFDIEMSGSLEGIGAILTEDPPYIKVVSVVPGGAAWRQKELEAEDKIIAVGQGPKEPISLIDMRVDDAVTYIRGKKGTEVRLTVKKPDGSTAIIPIVREVVETGASFAKSSVLTSKKLGIEVGYIKLPRFYRDFSNSKKRNCTDDVKKELISLKKSNVQAVILDLRQNGGGALEDANLMSGLFIKQGPIVQVRNRVGQVETLVDTDGSVTYDGPLIVMVNRLSASASEILAAAMQDYNRAIIVGTEYTHGKGTVQMVLNLNRGAINNMFEKPLGAIKLTLQKFYRISGGSTQFKGVTPDIFLPDATMYEKNREQDDKHALQWDEIKGVEFEKWHDFPYDLKKLSKKSSKRIDENKKYKQLNKLIAHIKKKKDDTEATLNLNELLALQAENKKLLDSIKLDDANTDLTIAKFETSLKFDKKKKKADKKLWAEDFKQRKEEWIESIQADYDIEEAMNIANDMIKTKK